MSKVIRQGDASLMITSVEFDMNVLSWFIENVFYLNINETYYARRAANVYSEG